MLDEATVSWTEARREDARERILAAAWQLAEQDGIGALSLRRLARTLGMAAPSLYAYFDSKAAVFDAMFAQGYEALSACMAAAFEATDPRARAAEGARRFLDFVAASPARYQLMFQRPVPDFEPSPASFARSQKAFAEMEEHFAEIGITEARHVDLFVAVTAGLAAQQMANDPTGDRWRSLVDDAVDAIFCHIDTVKGTP